MIRQVKSAAQNIAITYILRNETIERMPEDRIKASENRSQINSSSTRSLNVFLATNNKSRAKMMLIEAAYHLLNDPGKKEQIVWRIA